MSRILWVSYLNEYAWCGDIIGYRNIHTNEIISKETYEEMIKREAKEKWENMWENMNVDELTNCEDAENLWANILNSVETDYEALVEIIVDDNEDIEKYEPCFEMHWLEVLAIEYNMSIYEIAKKSNLTKSTLYSIISRKTQLEDISDMTLNAICKGLGITIMELIYKYEGRLF